MRSSVGTAGAEYPKQWLVLIFCGVWLVAGGAERSLRGPAVGRKNWMFLGSDHGGRTAAVLTSLISTSKRLGVDPFAYLRDIFERISRHPETRLAELLPDQWREAPGVFSIS